MEVWQIVLYGAAALLALKSLTSLMTAYRDRLTDDLARQEEEERQRKQARLKAERLAGKAANRPDAA